MNDYEAELKAKRADSIIYEDRGEIDMDTVHVDRQPCGAVEHMLRPCCKATGVYRIFGSYRDRHKGARIKRFDRNLCPEHLHAWAKLHGTTVAALLGKDGAA